MKLFLANTASFRTLITIIIIIANCVLTVISRKLTQEEWHTIRFGGDNANQWDNSGSNGDNGHNGPETHLTNVESDANIETNVQTVNVGKDKLVLVNDEGTIKMVRASQLPVVPKPESTTPPNLNAAYQSHDLHQYSSKTGTNNQHLSSNVRYITPNQGSGHQVSGLPVTYAIGSKSNMQRHISDDCPCRRSSEFPQIFMSAPETSAAASVNEKIKPRINMVRIIIEMPESLTKDVDEASRYAATQVKKMIVPSVVIHSSLPENHTGERKIKNVQEIIRKVVHLEDDYGEAVDEEKDDEKPEELHADNLQSNSNYVRLKSKTNTNGSENNKRYVVFRNVNKNNNGRRRRVRKNTDRIKGFDKYRKVIKIY